MHSPVLRLAAASAISVPGLGDVQHLVAARAALPGLVSPVKERCLPDGGQHYPALVLNADFRPLSYFPLSVWAWQDSIKAVFLDRVSVLNEYDAAVHSPSLSMKLPSVIALKEYIPAARRPAFTRFNVFLRDAFCCQYCAERHPTPDLTFDHVIPRSRGGRTTWENVVTACGGCNLRKGSRLPRECQMHPLHAPRQPTTWELQDNGRAFPPNYLHESWRDYLYWDSELEN
jgi:5-methylcytosine-specific restriction endonuclease McrA